jgi:hypothetical protein
VRHALVRASELGPQNDLAQRAVEVEQDAGAPGQPAEILHPTLDVDRPTPLSHLLHPKREDLRIGWMTIVAPEE